MADLALIGAYAKYLQPPNGLRAQSVLLYMPWNTKLPKVDFS
jgi:hypothetical protein